MIELLIVIAIIAITAGVSSDIILSLIRTYSKTKVTNELEQIGNIALLKMEKEMKSASAVDTMYTAGSCYTSLGFTVGVGGTPTNVIYTVSPNGSLTRYQTGDFEAKLVVDSTQTTGARINAVDNFCVVSSNPYVIKLRLEMAQADTSATSAFTAAVTLEQTVVIRGTYR